jgi:hypothetical protein
MILPIFLLLNQSGKSFNPVNPDSDKKDQRFGEFFSQKR